MTARQSDWPRMFLLQLYNAAIDQGEVYVPNLTAERAKSLTASFYRLRRRHDSSNATFITPEMHLVTVGKWEAGAGLLNDAGEQLGRLPILYLTPEHLRIEDASGNVIKPASPAENPNISAEISEGLAKATTELLASDPSRITMKPDEVSSYVERMKQAALAKDSSDAS